MARPNAATANAALTERPRYNRRQYFKSWVNSRTDSKGAVVIRSQPACSNKRTRPASPSTSRYSSRNWRFIAAWYSSRIRLESTSLRLFDLASARCEGAGIYLADTKFEFGFIEGKLSLIDEVLTPDSSRFWEISAWREGATVPSFDKQFVRDYLETLDWDKTPPGPELPEDVVRGTTERYREAARRICGISLS